ncbi:unnamed protein product, partial [Prorocentrum cordatum]
GPNVEKLLTSSAPIAPHAGPWAIFGDFNAASQEMRAWIEKWTARVCYPANAAHASTRGAGQRILDYVIASQSFADLRQSPELLSPDGGGHYSVKFVLHSAPLFNRRRALSSPSSMDVEETDVLEMLDNENDANSAQSVVTEAKNVEPRSEVMNLEVQRADLAGAIYPEQAKEYLIEEFYDCDQGALNLLWQEGACPDLQEEVAEGDQRGQAGFFGPRESSQVGQLSRVLEVDVARD